MQSWNLLMGNPRILRFYLRNFCKILLFWTFRSDQVSTLHVGEMFPQNYALDQCIEWKMKTFHLQWFLVSGRFFLSPLSQKVLL